MRPSPEEFLYPPLCLVLIKNFLYGKLFGKNVKHESKRNFPVSIVVFSSVLSSTGNFLASMGNCSTRDKKSIFSIEKQ